MDYLTRMYIVYGALLCFTVGSLIYFHYYFIIIGTIDESARVEPVMLLSSAAVVPEPDVNIKSSMSQPAAKNTLWTMLWNLVTLPRKIPKDALLFGTTQT